MNFLLHLLRIIRHNAEAVVPQRSRVLYFYPSIEDDATKSISIPLFRYVDVFSWRVSAFPDILIYVDVVSYLTEIN